MSDLTKINSTRLSCRTLAANAVRLQLHALAYNLGNFIRMLAMPKAAEPWSLTSLRGFIIYLEDMEQLKIIHLEDRGWVVDANHFW